MTPGKLPQISKIPFKGNGMAAIPKKILVGGQQCDQKRSLRAQSRKSRIQFQFKANCSRSLSQSLYLFTIFHLNVNIFFGRWQQNLKWHTRERCFGVHCSFQLIKNGKNKLLTMHFLHRALKIRETERIILRGYLNSQTLLVKNYLSIYLRYFGKFLFFIGQI